jgi:hypothetical protein
VFVNTENVYNENGFDGQKGSYHSTKWQEGMNLWEKGQVNSYTAINNNRYDIILCR